MIRLGKVYGNLMVDLMAVNEKLVDRGIRIIQDITNLDLENSRRILVAAKMSVKTALVMAKKIAIRTLLKNFLWMRMVL